MDIRTAVTMRETGKRERERERKKRERERERERTENKFIQNSFSLEFSVHPDAASICMMKQLFPPLSAHNSAASGSTLLHSPRIIPVGKKCDDFCRHSRRYLAWYVLLPLLDEERLSKSVFV
jgi:hypothetical protein